MDDPVRPSLFFIEVLLIGDRNDGLNNGANLELSGPKKRFVGGIEECFDDLEQLWLNALLEFLESCGDFGGGFTGGRMSVHA
jgi:hypothetical protein